MKFSILPVTCYCHSALTVKVLTVQEGISNMFEQAGCGTPAVRSLLGEGGVSEANMMQFLGILEQRTNEILQVSLTCFHPFFTKYPTVVPGFIGCDGLHTIYSSMCLCAWH